MESPDIIYVYSDKNGDESFQIHRWENNGDKTIRPYTNGEYKACPEPRALYNLPELSERPDAKAVKVPLIHDLHGTSQRQHAAVSFVGGDRAVGQSRFVFSHVVT